MTEPMTIEQPNVAEALEIPAACDYGNACPTPPAWVVAYPCCGEAWLLCQPHRAVADADVADGDSYHTPCDQDIYFLNYRPFAEMQ